MNPVTQTADKCTFCYHRITRGLKPACATVCPTKARQFGDLKDPKDEISLFLAKQPVQVLKPHLNTRPKVYYPDLDKEVS
jgi:tetrathionate reductase subunit B